VLVSQGPLLGISLNAAPLCPDAAVSARLEQYILVLSILSIAYPIVSLIIVMTSRIACGEKALVTVAFGLFSSLLGLAIVGYCAYGAVAILYAGDGATACKEPSLTVRKPGPSPLSFPHQAASTLVPFDVSECQVRVALRDVLGSPLPCVITDPSRST